jgi:hypothetical protein
VSVLLRGWDSPADSERSGCVRLIWLAVHSCMTIILRLLLHPAVIQLPRCISRLCTAVRNPVAISSMHNPRFVKILRNRGRHRFRVGKPGCPVRPINANDNSGICVTRNRLIAYSACSIAPSNSLASARNESSSADCSAVISFLMGLNSNQRFAQTR